MNVVESIEGLRKVLDGAGSIGLVPTMGYLHDGHMSLVEAAAPNDVTVMSIFVNPLQFGSSEDLANYPRDLDRDLAMAADAGVEVVFAPPAEEMYPGGHPTRVSVSVGRIAELLEGVHRPGHFNGAATVVCKLFNIVRPDRAYFGKKDAQQLAVIHQMVKDLDLAVEIVACPTVRESDGLAMSSRNLHLSPEERRAASVLSRALFAGRDSVELGEKSAATVAEIVDRIAREEPLARLQYVEVVDPVTFEQLDRITGQATIVIVAFVGSTRLIDNVDVDVGTGQPA